MNARATGTAEDRDLLLDTVASLWRDRPGPAGWVSSIDHKRIALRYAATAAGFLLVDGVLGLLMRSQLAEAEHDLLDPVVYRQLAGMHAITALQLVLVPMLQAVALYLVPLMVGARTIAMPRLNAFGYWTYLGGALVGLMAFVAGLWRATAGSGVVGDAGTNWMDLCTRVSVLCVALGVLATILRMRAPGMTLSRMPALVWAMLVASVVVLVVVPASLLDIVLARRMALGGPWSPQASVLALALLPVLGILAGIVETTARRAVTGHAWIIVALLAFGIAILAAWAQPFLAIDAWPAGRSRLVGLAGLALPACALAACWLATLWRRAWRADASPMPEPLVFALGAMLLLALGAVATAAPVAGLVPGGVGNTQYAVAAFHCIAGGAVFALFGALHAWFPKVTGKMLSGQIGLLQFLLLFVGFLATFLPLFWLGLQGMPRRAATYAAGLGWTLPNTIATLGAWMMTAGVLVLAFNLYYGRRNGRPAGDNPWRAPDLAWATHSPPPPYNFAAMPTVRDRHPAWEQSLPLHPDQGALQRTTALSTPVRATPRGEAPVPRPSLYPPIAAIALVGLAAWTQSVLHASAWAILLAVTALCVRWRPSRNARQ